MDIQEIAKDFISKEEISLIENKLKEVERGLEGIIEKESGVILEAGSYIFQSGGKKIRPALLLLTSSLCNYKGDADILFAQIIEIVHTATLIHDDIIDGSPERRGKPAAHIKFGNNLTVLLGDYFFSKAMDLAIDYGNKKILKILSETTLDMIKGEILSLNFSWDLSLNEKKHIEIIGKKTASLFSICTQIPAILAELPSEEEVLLKQFGYNLGIAFQLIDDLLDYTSSSSILGKPVGNDLKEGKITLPLIYLVRCAEEKELSKLIEPIRNRNYDEIDSDWLIKIMNKYNAFDYAKSIALKYAELASSYLGKLDNKLPKKPLLNLLNFILAREK